LIAEGVVQKSMDYGFDFTLSEQTPFPHEALEDDPRLTYICSTFE
jgi:hypothetical protein